MLSFDHIRNLLSLNMYLNASSYKLYIFALNIHPWCSVAICFWWFCLLTCLTHCCGIGCLDFVPHVLSSVRLTHFIHFYVTRALGFSTRNTPQRGLLVFVCMEIALFILLSFSQFCYIWYSQLECLVCQYCESSSLAVGLQSFFWEICW